MGGVSKKTLARRRNGQSGGGTGRPTKRQRNDVPAQVQVDETDHSPDFSGDSHGSDDEDDDDIQMVDDEDIEVLKTDDYNEMLSFFREENEELDSSDRRLKQFMTPDVPELKVAYERGAGPSRMTAWREAKQKEKLRHSVQNCRPLTSWFAPEKEVRRFFVYQT